MHLLGRGAPPALIAQQLHLSVLQIADALRSNTDFAERWRATQDLLSQNVVSALYRAAMDGNVSAQTFYLKSRPPPDWQTAAHPLSQSPDEMMNDDFLAQFQREAPLLLAQLASQSLVVAGTEQSPPVS